MKLLWKIWAAQKVFELLQMVKREVMILFWCGFVKWADLKDLNNNKIRKNSDFCYEVLSWEWVLISDMNT